MNPDKAYEEKTRHWLHKNAMSCIEEILEATSYKTAAVRPATTHLENYAKCRWMIYIEVILSFS